MSSAPPLQAGAGQASKADSSVKVHVASRPWKSYTSVPVGLSLVAATVLTGTAYILVEYALQGSVGDALFVSLLVAATAILLLGMRSLSAHLGARGLAFFAFTMRPEDAASEEDGSRKLWLVVFDGRKATLSGVGYGLAVACAPFLLDVWPGEPILRLVLCGFLFVVNFVTGVAFYSLITFFVQSIRLGPLVKVDLWHRENPSTTFFTHAARKICLLASVYVSLSLCSILFSPLPAGGLVLGYSVFATVTLVSTLIIPTIPVGRGLGKAKREALAEIDLQLQTEYRRMMGTMKSSSEPPAFQTLEGILALRQKVEAIETWPFKLKSVATSVFVALISSIPVVVQVFLTKGLGA